jgi:anion-transporting  ArsA/GET3 family ATPase
LIEALVRDNRVLVCVGPGGVGKTTIAAAVGALAARRGKRTLVCTIDPAPRLAARSGSTVAAASCTRCASTPRRRSSAS